mgnify:CR=1 FL=1
MQNGSDLIQLDEFRSQFPSAAFELDNCVTQNDYLALWSKANNGNLGEGMLQAALHAAASIVKVQVSCSVVPLLDQYIEDCIAVNVALASLVINNNFNMDRKTKKLIEEKGFLGGMIEQLKPASKIGKGNFEVLKRAAQLELSAEYCVWKWGQPFVDAHTLQKLQILASQYKFQ